MNDIIEEKWRVIDGFGGKYQVSNLGRVRTNTGESDADCRYLSIQTDHRKPRVVLFTPKGVKKTLSVAELVAKAFLYNPNNYPFLAYLDGDYTNTRVNNLMWVSAKDYDRYYRVFRNAEEEKKRRERSKKEQEEEERRLNATVWRDFPDGSFKISDRIFQDAANYAVNGFIRNGFFAPEKEGNPEDIY